MSCSDYPVTESSVHCYPRSSPPEPEILENIGSVHLSHIMPDDILNLYLQIPQFLVNMIRADEMNPGVSLVSDGALIVVDCTEGVVPETETTLRNVLAACIKLILVIDGIEVQFGLAIMNEQTEKYQEMIQ